ncbi:coiled-coil domain-containing protein 170 [Folsomia candida]|uniref:coiled-coil domain-containing protein 170 n=1 Tax=Folsomia candida TaxID=158441 RepID=UPI000B8FC93D|nr:coiled-coil domain-containing protein 170 [Folsomia candida]
MDHDEIPTETRLQSEIAALKYKNERLKNELREYDDRLKNKEQSIILQTNANEDVRENLARLTAINNSLQKKLQDAEDRERNQLSTISRVESDVQKFRHESQHYQERIVELESQLRSLLIDREASEQSKESAQRSLVEFCRKISSAIDFHDDPPKVEPLLKRVYEIYQENARYKMNVANLKQTLETSGNESKANSEFIQRLNNEKDNLNQQIVSCLTTIDLTKRERDQLVTEKSYLTTELNGYKEKAGIVSRTITSMNDQARNLEQQVNTLKESLFISEDRATKSEKELKNFQESVAIQMSSGSRMVEPTPVGIRERIKDLMLELKEKQYGNDQLREKVGRLQGTLERLEKQLGDSRSRQDDAVSERVILAKRLQDTEGQLTTTEILNDGLRKDKNRFMQFLEQLGGIMGLDEVSKELGFDLQTDAVTVRAEQLAKLEGDRLADKTASVYQLQRRVRTLKEQLEKKDLHLDMLRKKIMVLEDSVKMRTTLELERDEALSRARKHIKQIERIELELKEARINLKEMKGQLADATEYKIIALERARKNEELEQKVNDLELLRCKYNRKVNFIKDQLKSCRDNTAQERDLQDHAFQQLSQELNSTKKGLLDASRREAQLLNLRNMVGRILGIDWSKTVVPDYELISKLERIVQTNKEFAQVSRKLSDSMKIMPALGGEDCGDDSPRCSADSLDELKHSNSDGNLSRKHHLQ